MHNSLPRLYKGIIVTCITLTLTSCVPFFRAPPPTSADYCGIAPALLAQPPQHATVIEVWASAPRQHCWRAYALWQVAQEQPELRLSVKVRANNINGGPYRDELIAAAAQGKAPDISFLYHYHLPTLVQADYLYPLTECRQQPGLNAIPDALWAAMSPGGKAWGVPFEIELLLLYYNKRMLQKLGWTTVELERLPAQIASGQFDLTDLLAVAERAVERNVTQPGFAFVPHPGQALTMTDLHRAFGGRIFDPAQGQLVIDEAALQQKYAFLNRLHQRNLLDERLTMPDFSDWGNNILLRDAVAHGRTLFFHGYSSDWQQMVMDYAGNEQQKVALNAQLGVALLPIGAANARGAAFGSHLNLFVILNEKATGRRNQLAACQLLAAMQSTNLAQLHADKASQPTVRAGEIIMPSYWQMLGLQQIVWRPDAHPGHPRYARILAEVGAAVERGELGAAEAATLAIQQLQDALGDQLVVE